MLFVPTAALGYASSAIVRQNKIRTGGRGGGRGGRGGRLQDQPKFYCYHHGTNFSHNGSTCKYMRSSPIHTDAMLAALNGSTGGKAWCFGDIDAIVLSKPNVNLKTATCNNLVSTPQCFPVKKEHVIRVIPDSGCTDLLLRSSDARHHQLHIATMYSCQMVQ